MPRTLSVEHRAALAAGRAQALANRAARALHPCPLCDGPLSWQHEAEARHGNHWCASCERYTRGPLTSRRTQRAIGRRKARTAA